jgi:glycosyltransferase involved in cell wall biosynthesis
MVTVSVIIPVYGVEKYVANALESVLAQTYRDFEVIVVDDESPDRSIEICRSFTDPRIRIVQQKNRGLAGARNTGIRQSQGDYIALLDSDDLWLPEKLERQVAQLQARPDLGVSFCRAAFVDEQGHRLGMYQMPQLTNIQAADLFRANAVGSGSTPMIRRTVLEAIQFPDPRHGEAAYFDEQLRRSEDLECWIRILLQTPWKIEGLAEPLVLYRVNTASLSSDLLKQYESWEQVLAKTRRYAPDLVAKIERPTRAHQLRYLARRAIHLKDGPMAVQLINRSLASNWQICLQEPRGTVLTLLAAYLMRLLPPRLYARLENLAVTIVSRQEQQTIQREMQRELNHELDR